MVACIDKWKIQRGTEVFRELEVQFPRLKILIAYLEGKTIMFDKRLPQPRNLVGFKQNFTTFSTGSNAPLIEQGHGLKADLNRFR
jgi:hypothetical protein